MAGKFNDERSNTTSEKSRIDLGDRKPDQGMVRPFSAQDPDDTPPARVTPATLRDLVALRHYDEISH